MTTPTSTEPAASTDPRSARDELGLAQKARELLPVLRRQARRPYIVELAGTPKAGKTTALHVLHRFLKECGYHVHEMRERAADCPIAMKGHFFFNTWTTATMLASMIESLESEADVVLLDRGVFDAIVWLEAQSQEHQVSPEEREIFRNFVMLDRWRKLTDLTIVLRVEPETALERENKDLLVPRTGSIMDGDFLTRYNSVLEQVQAQTKNEFQFCTIDTTGHRTPRTTTLEIAADFVKSMSRWADPEIAALPLSVVERLFGDRGFVPLPSAMEEIEQELVFKQRSRVDQDEALVGLVGAAVLHHEGKMLLLRRSEEHDEKRTKFGRDVLWKGCHVARRPSDASDLLATAAAAVKTRLKEDFHLARFESEPHARFLVWNRTDPQDARHLGIIFDFEISDQGVAESLASKVFKRERDRTKLGRNQFISPEKLQFRVEHKEDIDLESWSREVLRQRTVARS